jgi:hypothetical protein
VRHEPISFRPAGADVEATDVGSERRDIGIVPTSAT